ncbi:alpha-hydroxy acid oxidase [Pseudomonas typographi]|uniref:Alpha-hydroxy-acid oxidizing protein n=1 Tax=Pseudomonas typographi TaxID=2715964 RepID=A0ABR7Z2P9_9PSED|nr:alpha-hydroxy acid oxidase [Pseudomonas typographi]MBD1553134.1 alpha-hydroxy-acid oxidizing protein [Pseudomonas typographi]MBD1585879.1 alpha-hydroxy-acid oxidizing protein [Pseudomonas typographi]MBD1599755.1 alpha-hydroxy-acid oxidizing protein [Pseudomonas typographi]
MNSWETAQNVDDLRRLAKAYLPKGFYQFIARGSEGEVALHHNRQALDAVKIKPRALVDVFQRSTQVQLFGQTLSMPLMIAPTGAAGLLRYQGEAQMARAAAAAGIPYTLAMATNTPLEVVRRHSSGQLWLQLYLSPRSEINRALLQKASKLGYDGLMLTVDTPVAPNREYNWRNGFSLPVTLNRRNALDLLGHPRWLLGVMGRYWLREGLPRFEPFERNTRAGWSTLQRLREDWAGPLVVKGIGCPEDAALAVQAGVDGLVLSNHGARNLDSSAAPITLLAQVAAEVAGRVPILMDGAITRGSDIFKALAMGASGVLIGRAALYGLAAGGEAGAARTLALLHEELDRCMGYAGARTVAEIDPSRINS